MAIIQQISTTKIEKKRLDPSYYLLPSRASKSTRKNRLDNISKVTIGKTPKQNTAIKDTDRNTFLLTATDVHDYSINKNPKKAISQKSAKKHPETKVKKYDILMTVKGKIANSALVTKDTHYYINQNIAKITPNKKQDAYALLAILNSKYVKQQILGKSLGQMNPHIRKSDLVSILIPEINKTEKNSITQKMKRILRREYKVKTKMNALIDDVEREYTSSASQNKKTFSTNISEITKNKRLDPEYYNIVQSKQTTKEKKINLGTVPKVKIRLGAYSKDYIKKGISYLRAKDIPNIELKKCAKIKPCSNQVLLTEGDIIITRAGSPGKSFLIQKDQLPAAASDNFIIISSQDSCINPTTLFLTLNTAKIKRHINSHASGSKQPSISIKTIKNITLPNMSLKSQKQLEKKHDHIRRLEKENKDDMKRLSDSVNKIIENT